METTELIDVFLTRVAQITVMLITRVAYVLQDVQDTLTPTEIELPKDAFLFVLLLIGFQILFHKNALLVAQMAPTLRMILVDACHYALLKN